MTLEELANLGGKYSYWVPPRIAADIIGCYPYSLTVSARQAQAKGLSSVGAIGFVRVGTNHYKFSKADLLKSGGYMAGGG